MFIIMFIELGFKNALLLPCYFKVTSYLGSSVGQMLHFSVHTNILHY